RPLVIEHRHLAIHRQLESPGVAVIGNGRRQGFVQRLVELLLVARGHTPSSSTSAFRHSRSRETVATASRRPPRRKLTAASRASSGPAARTASQRPACPPYLIVTS